MDQRRWNRLGKKARRRKTRRATVVVMETVEVDGDEEGLVLGGIGLEGNLRDLASFGVTGG